MTTTTPAVPASALMPPPPPRPPAALARPATVLEEDEWTMYLEEIIERDFFPDLSKLKNRLDWLQASRSGDAEAIRAAQLRIQVRVPRAACASLLHVGPAARSHAQQGANPCLMTPHVRPHRSGSWVARPPAAAPCRRRPLARRPRRRRAHRRGTALWAWAPLTRDTAHACPPRSRPRRPTRRPPTCAWTSSWCARGAHCCPVRVGTDTDTRCCCLAVTLHV